VVGGSALPESMIRDFDKHGITTLHAWGMTELTPLGTLSRLKRGMEGQERGRALRGARQARHAGALCGGTGGR
jgi:fatty-acyl-CoA synthase